MLDYVLWVLITQNSVKSSPMTGTCR